MTRVRVGRRGHSPELRGQVLAAYSSGRDLDEIEDEFGVIPKTTCQWGRETPGAQEARKQAQETRKAQRKALADMAVVAGKEARALHSELGQAVMREAASVLTKDGLKDDMRAAASAFKAGADIDARAQGFVANDQAEATSRIVVEGLKTAVALMFHGLVLRGAMSESDADREIGVLLEAAMPSAQSGE